MVDLQLEGSTGANNSSPYETRPQTWRDSLVDNGKFMWLTIGTSGRLW